MSRKLHLVLTGLLLAGIAACTGEGNAPSEGTAVDPCGVFTAKELAAVTAAGPFEPDGRLVATRRYVTLDQSAPTDYCTFDQAQDTGFPVERALEVRVTTNRRYLELVDQSHPIEDLADEAYFSGGGARSNATLTARRGELLVVVTLRVPSRGGEQAVAPEPLITAVRPALERLPSDGTVAGLAAEGPCARIDLRAVGAALKGRVGYSRSLSTRDEDGCSFTAGNGERARLTLTKRPDGRAATAVQRREPKLDLTGVDAYWHDGEAVVYGDGQALSIQAPTDVTVPEAELTPGLVRLAGAAAKAYRLERPPAGQVGGADPCALLTPEEAGRLVRLDDREHPPLRPVSRAVWSYGDDIAVDTCGYDGYRLLAGERPDVEVGLSRGHYDPVTEDDIFDREPEPVDSLGDRAYFVQTSDEAWLVVERGEAQLTIHAKPGLRIGDVGEDARPGMEHTARAALRRLPARLDLPAIVADPPCSEVGAAVAGAAGGELRYTRGVTSEFAAECTFTMADGTAVQVALERSLTGEDLRNERARPRQAELVTAFGDRSMLTISVHEAGKRAFPRDLGPDGSALAGAAKPLLD